MKRVFYNIRAYSILMLLLFGSSLYGQENETEKDDRSFVFNMHQYGGVFLNQNTKGFIMSFNGQLQTKNLFGIGAEISNGFFESPNLNQSPPIAQISNYPEDGSDVVTGVRVNGSSNDRFSSFSVYVSKELEFASIFGFDFQVGPSLSFNQVQSYTYFYSGGSNFGSFGGFFIGGGGPNVRAESTEQERYGFGVYLRVSTKLKLGKVFRLELSPFANINTVNTVLGGQIGIGFRF